MVGVRVRSVCAREYEVMGCIMALGCSSVSGMSCFVFRDDKMSESFDGFQFNVDTWSKRLNLREIRVSCPHHLHFVSDS